MSITSISCEETESAGTCAAFQGWAGCEGGGCRLHLVEFVLRSHSVDFVNSPSSGSKREMRAQILMAVKIVSLHGANSSSH